MPRVCVRHEPHIELEYETFGNSNHPCLVLVAGLGAQLLSFPEVLCEMLAAEGLFVIRFDNRDAGLSTRLDSASGPSLAMAALRHRMRLRWAPVYSLSQMASDVGGLLDAISISAAHIAGVSMGGMIAQTFAIEHPERALSLSSIMSSTSDPSLPAPPFSVQMRMLRPRPLNPHAAVDWLVQGARLMGSRRFFCEIRARGEAERAVSRSWYPAGVIRQTQAVLSASSRAEALAGLAIPSSVIHGTDDVLVLPAHGIATADAIPNSELYLIDDLAHDLPLEVWPFLIEIILRTIRRGERPTLHRQAA